jgi:putative Holliday junction resolvase
MGDGGLVEGHGAGLYHPEMPISNPADLGARLQQGERLLGLDVGTKTIGVALSDPLRMVASPVETIRRGRFRTDAERLARFAREHGVGGVVIGLPVSMDGSEGPRCQSVRQFGTNLAPFLPLPTAFWDERLSTAAVEREMIAHDMTRKRRAEIIDRVAAAYILQGYLDWLRRAAAG